MFTKYVNEKSSGRFRQIFVAFSQYLNFIMFLAGVLHKVYGVKSFLDYSYFYPPFFSRVIPKNLKKDSCKIASALESKYYFRNDFPPLRRMHGKKAQGDEK